MLKAVKTQNDIGLLGGGFSVFDSNRVLPRNFEDMRADVQTDNTLGSMSLDFPTFIAEFAAKVDDGLGCKLFPNGWAKELFQFALAITADGAGRAGFGPAVAVEDGVGDASSEKCHKFQIACVT